MKRTLAILSSLLLLVVFGAVMAARAAKHYMNAAVNHIDVSLKHMDATLNTRIEGVVRQALNADVHNVEKARYEKALRETADFIDESMPLVASFGDARELLKYGLERVDSNVKGLFCEFGVFTGGSINFIASLTDKPVHGFDSFEGLPEDWRGDHRKGTFKVDKLPEVRPNVVLHKGWFNESLPVFKQKFNQPMSFMHLDADLYSSTKTVFDVLGDRIVSGHDPGVRRVLRISRLEGRGVSRLPRAYCLAPPEVRVPRILPERPAGWREDYRNRTLVV